MEKIDKIGTVPIYFEKIREYCEQNHLWNIPKEEAEYLFALICEKKISKILECGTGGGYSTLWLARAAELAGGAVTTIESNLKRFDAAKIIFENSGLKNINQIKGHCPECLAEIKDVFDFIFIDVVKHHYIKTFVECMNLINPKGIIAADNIFTHPQETSDFIEYIQSLTSFKTEIINIGNGLSISYLI